jgi:hypothetical protein
MSTATLLMLKNTRDALDYYTDSAKAAALANERIGNHEYHVVAVIEVGEVTGTDAGDELYDLTNNPGRQIEREAKYGRGRSMSVGDVVRINGEEYLCVSFGWIKI